MFRASMFGLCLILRSPSDRNKEFRSSGPRSNFRFWSPTDRRTNWLYHSPQISFHQWIEDDKQFLGIEELCVNAAVDWPVIYSIHFNRHLEAGFEWFRGFWCCLQFSIALPENRKQFLNPWGPFTLFLYFDGSPVGEVRGGIRPPRRADARLGPSPGLGSLGRIPKGSCWIDRLSGTEPEICLQSQDLHHSRTSFIY
jgi:hypothetical protein